MDSHKPLNDRETRYRETVKVLSDRIVEAQRPIRILDAVKWDASVRQAFLADPGRSAPAVDRVYYEKRPLPFEAAAKRIEFETIARDVRRSLGQFNPLGRMMDGLCREYVDVVRMLEARGQAEFTALSQQLYGSSTDAFHAGDPTLADLADLMSETLANLSRETAGEEDARDLDSTEAVALLDKRLSKYFHESEHPVRVMLSDGIVSDAAAGADYIKIRTEASFSKRDVRVLEVHEGWVHLGTTLNGLSQPVCTFLGKGAPSSTVTQEGLAVVLEIFSFSAHPARLKRVVDRVHAVNMAEEGASFVDCFRHFQEDGMSDEEAWSLVSRVFRGSTPDGGPFTKDLAYSKGFILIYNFLRLAVRRGRAARIPLLFCGKCGLDDIGTLAQLVDEGIVVPPRFVPPPFDDLPALSSWMAYSNFLNRLDLSRIEADYASLLS